MPECLRCGSCQKDLRDKSKLERKKSKRLTFRTVHLSSLLQARLGAKERVFLEATVGFCSGNSMALHVVGYGDSAR